MANKTFRVFVSSTFSDLVEERNALARWVFPKLRTLCERRGYKFQAVDLRWGVREEAAADQQAVRICLDEIARCQKLSPKPNFIVLLGDRYGWCPPPATIAGADVDALRPHFASDEAQLIFGLGDSAGPGADDVTKTGWYRLDQNAVPPEWVLQPRRGECAAYAAWEPVERRLRAAIARAAIAAKVSQEKRSLHGASATELEIVDGALDVPDDVPDAREHVFGFFRTIRNLDDVKASLPATVGHSQREWVAPARSAASAALDLLDTRIASSADEAADDSPLTWDEDAWRSLQSLKGRLESRIGARNVWRWEATWSDGQLHSLGLGAPAAGTPATPNDIQFQPGTLCHEVYQRLSRVITAQIDALDGQDDDKLQVDIDAHVEFAKRRVEGFKGRERPLAGIARYLASDVPRPLVVHAESGSGKSALMARAAELAREAHPNAVVIQRFIGAVPGASEARSLLESLCRELSRAFVDNREIDDRYEKLVQDFPQRLGLARADKPVLLFVDALDQLGDVDDGRCLAWLPRTLPPHVRLVVSTLPDDQYMCFPELRARADAEDLLRLEKLSIEDGGKVFDAWLEGQPARRTVTEAQRAEVLGRFRENGLPLYLRLAFEEARRWHSYDGAPSGGLAHNIPDLIRALFARLSRQHGEIVVCRALGFLAASRYGLSDDEMLALLWRDDDVRQDFDRKKHHELPEGDSALPPIVWSRLHFDLEPYLAQRQVFGVGLLAFYHRQMAEVATEAHLSGDRRRPVHRALAKYFTTRWEIPDTHALLELVGHLLAAGRLDEADAFCRNAPFLRLRCAALGPRAVEEELISAAARLEKDGKAGHRESDGKPLLLSLARAVRQESHWLRRMNESGLPLWFDDILYNWLLSTCHPAADIERLVEGLQTRARLRHPLRTGQADRVLVGHTGPITRCALNADHGLAISCSKDGTLRLWDTKRGVELRLLQGHNEEVIACALNSNGTRALSGSFDHTLRLWDVESGTELLCFKLQSAQTCCAFSPDGKLALSGGTDGALRLWDLKTQSEMLCLRGHTTYLSACAFSPDGSQAFSGSGNETLRIWDLRSGEELLRESIGQSFGFGGYWAIGSGSYYLYVLHTNTRSLRKQHSERLAGATATAISEDGKVALVGSWFGTIVLLDVDGERELRQLHGHASRVRCCAISGDAAVALSASDDCTLRLWNLDRDRAPVGRGDEVKLVALSAQGDRAMVVSAYAPDAPDAPPGPNSEIQVRSLVSGRIFAPPVETGQCWGLSWNGTLGLVSRDPTGGTLEVVDLVRGKYVRRLTARTERAEPIVASAFDDDGRSALCISQFGLLRTWNIRTGRLIRSLRLSSGDHWALSPKGARALATTSLFESSSVWDTDTGQLVTEFGDGGLCCALSRDGNIALTSSVSRKTGARKNVLHLWATDTGRELQSLSGHTDLIVACALSADGRWAVSASLDSTVRIWKCDDGRCEHVVCGGAPFAAVAISVDSLVASDNSGNLWMMAWAPLAARGTDHHLPKRPSTWARMWPFARRSQ